MRRLNLYPQNASAKDVVGNGQASQDLAAHSPQYAQDVIRTCGIDRKEKPGKPERRLSNMKLPHEPYDRMVCEALLSKYGKDAQFLKLIEECGELIRITAKRLLNLEEATNDNMIHEIVDVMVILTQMHCIFGHKELASAYHCKLQELVVQHELKIQYFVLDKPNLI